MLICECATRHLVPTRCPVLFLARITAVPGGLALRANFEVLLKAYNLTPVVDAKYAPLQRHSTIHVELLD